MGVTAVYGNARRWTTGGWTTDGVDWPPPTVRWEETRPSTKLSPTRIARAGLADHISAMTVMARSPATHLPSHHGLRLAALALGAASGAALGGALALEWWGGLVPCALCLWERWPNRVLIALALLALALPRRAARAVLGLAAVAALAGAGLGATHVGVEQGWWPSPLPECAAPNLGGGTVAERLARMPALPAKPCDAPTYLVPGLPVSMAGMNLALSLGLSLALGGVLLMSPLRSAAPSNSGAPQSSAHDEASA